MYPEARVELISEFEKILAMNGPERAKKCRSFTRRWSGQARGIYRHYKGGLYVLQGFSIYEATLTPMVNYMGQNGVYWTRDVPNFFGAADDGRERFRRMVFHPADPEAAGQANAVGGD